MPSDYRAITAYNEQQLGLDTASRKTQVCMYSDLTHFVYEILQNADDYEATEILFHLSRSELIIEHDGLPFQEEHVKAITYFGKSTSAHDLVKTGRFGVGFKSVFAFTATPIIISGDEYFKIHGLYRVSDYPYPEGFSRRRTRIVLPFNHMEEKPDYVDELIPAMDAYTKIAKRLTELNMHTLLFTRNIREIRWEIDEQSGHYLREDKPRNNSRETQITDGDIVSSYLVFARTPTWDGKKHKDVEISFGLDKNGQLKPINDYLYVLFSTTQETHLQFIINGPYRTNPSRETISEDDRFNNYLMEETCQLFTSVLPDLRDRGLLTTNALAVMPNNTDQFRKFYSPLLDTTVATFSNIDLVPTHDGKFSRAKNVLQGPAPMREVITNKELSFLAGKDGARWAKGVILNSRSDQFLKSLDIPKWGWGELEKSLMSKYGRYYYLCPQSDYIGDAAWLEAQSDQWMQKMYMLLADAIAKGECKRKMLGECRIVRVTENGKQRHVRGEEAYFPKDRGYKDLPQIKRTILRGKNESQTNKIEEALRTLGVKQIGDEERIDSIIGTYYRDNEGSVSSQQHLNHMKLFIRWWKNKSSIEQFRGESIFRTNTSDKFIAANDCYIDDPIRPTGLNVVYRFSQSGRTVRHKLWARYQELNGEGFSDFAVACGVEAELSIVQIRCDLHPKKSALRQDYNQYGVKFTKTGIDLNYTIKDLASLLNIKDCKVNQLIWDTVRASDPATHEASFRPNRQYATRKEQSSLVLALSKAEWIPDKQGRLRKPADITKEELHPSFKYDNHNGWLDEIGFGANEKKASEQYKKKKEMEETFGIPVEYVEYFAELSKEEKEEELEDLKSRVKKKKAQRKKTACVQQTSVPFHDALGNAFSANVESTNDELIAGGGTTKNPSLRREKTQEEILASIDDEGSSGPSFSFRVRKQWKGKNDTVRTALAGWYGGKCQICGKTFIQRNGNPYFEGLYLVPFTKAEWLDRVGNVLCLCPWHSAMFQFGEKVIEGDIVQLILDMRIKSEGGDSDPALPMKLCGEDLQITFVENHLLDLQEMIKASRSATKCDEIKELIKALETILLKTRIPLDIRESISGEVIIPANHIITKTLIRRIAENADSIHIDPSPIRIKIMSVINDFVARDNYIY